MTRGMPTIICGCGAPQEQVNRRGRRDSLYWSAEKPRTSSLVHSQADRYARAHARAHERLGRRIAEPPSAGQCWCCSLRGGCISVAVVFAVIAVITLFFCIYLHPAEEEFHDDDKRRVALIYKVFAVIAGIKIIFSGLLLLGILRERSELMRPWLVSYFVLCPMEATALWSSAFLACVFHYWVAAGVLFFFSCTYLVLYGFCLYVVYCYFISIAEETIIEV